MGLKKLQNPKLQELHVPFSEDWTALIYLPSLFFTFTSAPFSTRHLTMSTRLLTAAPCSAVDPKIEIKVCSVCVYSNLDSSNFFWLSYNYCIIFTNMASIWPFYLVHCTLHCEEVVGAMSMSAHCQGCLLANYLAHWKSARELRAWLCLWKSNPGRDLNPGPWGLEHSTLTIRLQRLVKVGRSNPTDTMLLLTCHPCGSAPPFTGTIPGYCPILLMMQWTHIALCLVTLNSSVHFISFPANQLISISSLCVITYNHTLWAWLITLLDISLTH